MDFQSHHEPNICNLGTLMGSSRSPTIYELHVGLFTREASS
jgi:1,4-alpha-glucan branching enzyme